MLSKRKKVLGRWAKPFESFWLELVETTDNVPNVMFWVFIKISKSEENYPLDSYFLLIGR